MRNDGPPFTRRVVRKGYNQTDEIGAQPRKTKAGKFFIMLYIRNSNELFSSPAFYLERLVWRVETLFF